MKFGTGSHVSHRMNPDDDGDPTTLYTNIQTYIPIVQHFNSWQDPNKGSQDKSKGSWDH